jgi:hypothetical protein
MAARRWLIALVILVFAAGVSRAEAEPITLSFGFIATGFGPGAPVDPVTGSFTITFDNSTNLVDQTTGLTYSHLNIALDSAPSFSYGRVADVLVLGAAVNGAQTLGGATNDLLWGLNNVSSSPVAAPGFTYAQASHSNFFQGQVFLTPFAASTPEPASLVLIGTGALAIVGRRQRDGRR